MIVRLPFGRETLPVDLRGLRVHNLQPTGRRAAPDAGLIAERAVDRPLDGLPLADKAQGRRSALVVVPDATRRVDLPRVLPPILKRLLSSGIRESRLRILIACGTHPPASEGRVAKLVGSVPIGVEVRQHDSRDTKMLVGAGRLVGGNEIRLHRWIFETDLLVTLSAVRHHYFAGFGGGPKMIFPGVAGYEEIQTNHSRVVMRATGGLRRHSRCEPGVLEGNPVAEEIAEAADLRPPDLALCLVPGVDGGFAEAFAGGWRAAWGAAIERVRSVFEIPAGEFELVIGTAGGHPSDETLIQAHKGLDALCRFARPGAEVGFAASLNGGLGSPDMETFVRDPRPEAILERLARRWVQYGHTTLRILEKTSSRQVHLISRATRESAEGLGFLPARSFDDVLQDWRDHWSGATVGVMSGPPVFPKRPATIRIRPIPDLD